MKIRYYLRGLGLGILVTAIFFVVSGNESQPMSDEMIKARARELGMSESVVLSELSGQEETTAESVEEIITEGEQVVEQTIEESLATEEIVTEEMVTEEIVTEDAASEEAASEETINEETVVEAESQSADGEESEQESESQENTTSNTEPVTVTVHRGEGSDTVSRRLQEVGLVADAYEYDKYLMANGYDKRIGVGDHVVPAGATWEDIAKILCNMK